jgi:3'-phosphoadenosine 5'-phosphosulfate sulfotransferase (PAPS reductase)/FAD synthetase
LSSLRITIGAKMNNVVSFSGGRTSAYLVHLMEQKRKAGEIDNVYYVFMDTGAEHPKTYEFIRKCVKHFGIDLICLRVDVNKNLGEGNSYKVIPINECKPDLKPFADMCQKYGTPQVHAPFCTTIMKRIMSLGLG